MRNKHGTRYSSRCGQHHLVVVDRATLGKKNNFRNAIKHKIEIAMLVVHVSLVMAIYSSCVLVVKHACVALCEK